MDKTYCIFGDSVTQAAYVKTGWVDLLKTYLEEKYGDDFINIFNLGIGGNTSGDILKRFNSEAEVREPTDIIFAVGVNDSGYIKTLDKPIVSEEEFMENIQKLVELSHKLTKKITFIGLVIGDDSLLKPFPGSSQGKSYERERVENYNNKVKQIAELNDCKFVQLLDKLNPGDFQDGLHPNEEGHRKIFDALRIFF